MKYQVIKKYKTEFLNPISFFKGDKLVVGKKYNGNSVWNDWYFCETENRLSGWVPKQVIKWTNDNEGEALENYSAKEMDVNEGDLLIGIKILNGWLWCQHGLSKQEGWVPLENLIEYKV